MSKELSEETKYEFNVYARQLSKDLSNLMDCLRKQDEDNKAILYVGRHIKKKIILPYEEYQKMCQRLEAIDNAKPSEALESWQWINATIPQWVREKDKEHPNVLEPIKQALLKAQEQEKVLEIINEKNVLIYNLKIADNSAEYNRWVDDESALTQEEFDLLKRYCDEQNNK